MSMLHRPTMVRAGVAAAVTLVIGCASAPREDAGTEDRTGDPEFVSARQAARPEFETQADALAAGVYEPFVHPDSIGPSSSPAAGDPVVTTPRVAGDPSTAELVGTLGLGETYNPVAARRSNGSKPWTLQMGAFSTEAGALVRIRQIETDFPHQAVWSQAEPGVSRLYRVFLGRYRDRSAAERAWSQAVRQGYTDAWIARIPQAP